MEMAFVDQEDVMAMAEKVIAAIWKSAGYDVQLPIQRITWQDAMDKYGSDKPDLRFGNPLVELTEYFKDTPFRVFQADYVAPSCFKGGAAPRVVSSTHGRSGPSSAAPRASPTCPSPRTASSRDPSPRTCPTPSARA